MTMVGRWWAALRPRVLALIRRRQLDQDLEDEMAFYLAMKAGKNQAQGMAPAEAHDDAQRRFGNPTWLREACREVWSLGRIEIWWRDVRYGTRMMMRSPGFTAVAVLSLALGIGVNTLVFSLFNGVMLKPLPVPRPDRLRVVNWTGRNVTRSYYFGSGAYTSRSGEHVDGSFSYPIYRAFLDGDVGFSDLFAFSELIDIPAVFRGEASTSYGLIVSGNFFRGLGVRPALGRTFNAEDDRAGAPPVAVVSHAWWQRQAGGDPELIGQTLLLGGTGYTVVGILPPDFRAPVMGPRTDFCVPMAAQPLIAPVYPLSSTRHWWVRIMGRLSDGADERQAQAALAVRFARMSEQLQSGQKIERPGVLVEDGRAGPVNGARRRMQQILFLLMGVVALVLLIACANLASLLLARGAVRTHEMALRVAIGAGRFPLIRQLLTESSLLALAGGGLGLVLTPIGTSLLAHMLAGIEEAPTFDLRIDYRVLLFTLGLSLLTALLCGLLPALRATRSAPATGLRNNRAHGVQRLRLVRALVAVQVALSLLLLVGAGLFLKTLAGLSLADPGFRTQDVLTLRLDASKAGYQGRALVDFYERARQSFAAIPGVHEVSTSNLALLGHGVAATAFSVPRRGDSEQSQADLLHVGESFFSTMGIPLLMGRDLSAADNEAGSKVAIVNETLARTLLSGLNPVGVALRIGDADMQVVGVCRDAKYEDLGRTSPTIYLPYRQYPGETGAMFFEVRTLVPPLSVAATVRRNVAALDRNVPLTSMRTQAGLVDDSLLPFRLIAGLCACFGILALLLSAIGLYGVMSFAVAQRTNEIGVRLALGARRDDVLRMVLRDALAVVGIGLALGIPAAAGATFIAQRTLYGIRLLDPIVPAVAIGALLAVGAVAAAFPALRAARVDPVISLRHE